MMLSLQAQGCHTLNFVTPSHVVAQIIAGVNIAAQKGLYIPLTNNSGGYDSPEALALLHDIIDIYARYEIQQLTYRAQILQSA